MTKKTKSLYHGHRFPAAVISCAVRWYFRFQLSLRDIEELLFERGVIVTYETIQCWCDKFGKGFTHRGFVNLAKFQKILHAKVGKRDFEHGKNQMYSRCRRLKTAAQWDPLVGSFAKLTKPAEGLYAEDANPVMSMFAEEGIRSLARALPDLCAHPDDLVAREVAQYGALLRGTVLGGVGMAPHHKLCHTLVGAFNLPHAETHAIILPYAMAFNLQSAPDAASSLFSPGRALNVPSSLAALGLIQHDLDRAAELAMTLPYFNPRPLSRDAIRRLLQMVFDGAHPDESSFAGV